jgi:hypothetical protein
MGMPALEAAEALLTPIDVAVTLEAIFKFTTATAPFGIMAAVKP